MMWMLVILRFLHRGRCVVLDICTALQQKAYGRVQHPLRLQLILLVDLRVPARVLSESPEDVDACRAGDYSQASGG